MLIRRPHAYEFRQEHPTSVIPGLTVMNADGRVLGGTAVPSKKAVSTIIELLKKKGAVVR